MLSWLSLAWMGVEGGVGFIAGLIAGSIALEGFGLSSSGRGHGVCDRHLAVHRVTHAL